MNQTANYQLSQWERTDKVQMDDFNADNAKIDAALSAQAQTLTAHTAELARKGNCQFGTYTYRGNGTHGEANPTTIPFPKGTVLLVIMTFTGVFHALLPGTTSVSWSEGSSGTFSSPITWTETGLSIYSNRREAYQFNSSGQVYTVLSFRMADKA